MKKEPNFTEDFIAFTIVFTVMLGVLFGVASLLIGCVTTQQQQSTTQKHQGKLER